MKDDVCIFRLSKAEHDDLRQKAARAGLNESQYLRLLIHDHPGEFPEIKTELRNLYYHLGKIGTNINQIARAQNAALFSQDDKISLLQDMKKIMGLLEEVKKRL